MLKALTVRWNRDRGLLDKFDPKLELKMLSEEAKEFYAAETLAHMLAEFADFLFVLDGTKAKFGSQLINSHLDLDLRLKVYSDIIDWAHKVMADMDSCLHSMLSMQYNETTGLINMARRIVIKCNELKGSEKDKDGKVVKTVKHVDPVRDIQLELDRLGF